MSDKNMIREMPQSNQLTYDDILKKIGVTVNNGRLQTTTYTEQPHVNNYFEQNSYIYNKYFKDYNTTQTGLRQPKSLNEYRDMLIQDIIQQYRIKQIKSKKISLPINQNFGSSFISNVRTRTENKLFSFSEK